MQNSPAARQAVVVGAGFAGAVTARELADHGYQVKILERRAQIGGNMYDYPRDGVLTHLYGPHIFHTGNQKVFEYLSRFTRWVPYEHWVLGRIKGKYVPIPFNFRSMEELFPSEEAAMLREKLTAAYPGQDRVSVLDLVHNPDPDIARLGEFVFENVFVHYTAKQWGMPVEQVDTSVINRVPVVLGYDDRYFRDPIQMMPEQGFTPLFEAMLDHENITVELDTDARSRLTLTEDGRILLDGEAFTGPVIYTGAPDELLDCRLGALPYRSLRLDFETLETDSFQPASVVNYPNEEDFTRITEFKKLTGQTLPGRTVILREYPAKYQPNTGMEAYYPIDSEESHALYQRYREEFARYGNLYFCGRLAEYRYYNMDAAVDAALRLSAELVK